MLRLRFIHIKLFLAGCLWLGVCASVRGAQDPNAATAGPNEPNATGVGVLPNMGKVTAADVVTVELLQSLKKEAAANPDLDEEARTALVGVYDKAIAALKLGEELAAKRKQYRQGREAAPGALEDIRKRLAALETKTEPNVPAELTLATAEQSLAQATQELEKARTAAAELEAEPKRRVDRRAQIVDETKRAQDRIAEIDKQATPATETPTDPLERANRMLRELGKKASQNRIDAGSEEVQYYDATGDLLAAQRDLAAKQLTAAEKLVTFWQGKVTVLQQAAADEAKRQAEAAKEQMKTAEPVLVAIAEENAKLADLQAKLVGKVQETTTYSKTISSLLEKLNADYKDISRQVDTAAGVTDTMGLLLLGQREKLPNITENKRRIRNRPGELAMAQLGAMEYDKQWSQMSDMTGKIEDVNETLDVSMDPDRREAILEEAKGYFENRRKLVRAISDLYWDYATKLVALDQSEQSLVETVTVFSDFIDANVLWVRTRHGIGAEDIRESAAAVQWLSSGAGWRSTWAAVWANLKEEPSYYAMMGVLTGVFVFIRKRLRDRIALMAERLRQARSDRFGYTVYAMGLTLVLAMRWPLLLVLIHYRLVEVAADDFTRAIAVGVMRVAWVVFALSLLRHMTMDNGLAQAHFRMRADAAVFVRRHLGWFLVAAIPVVFVFEVLRVQQQNDLWYATAGRLVLIVGLLEWSVFLGIVLRPTGPLMEYYLKQSRSGWMERLRYLWYLPCMLIPAGFAVLAGMGYLYGARHLTQKLILTMGLMLLVLLVRALFVRSLSIAQRRLAILERLKLVVSRQQTEPSADAAGSGSRTEDAGEDRERTIFEMSQQTRRLIGAVSMVVLLVGLWWVWSDVLPALAGLGEYGLYTSGEKEITLGAVVAALVIALVTIAVARNVPGLLEIMVLRRLPIDRGVRFAIITMCRYVLVVIGAVMAFTEIGIGWAKVQWLVAAMTVGLGFGLQEIFANFVSGLIILFEQPIRVDDVVTVGEVTGNVTKIKIRATTIRQWDQKELIVPNREFITGRLVNWTLSDSMSRLDVCVGIAYGSDVRKAEQLLYEVARADSRVLKEPEPMVLFKAFGESSLDFELRVHVANISDRFPTLHNLHMAIDDAFRKAGIEIAFPQQDLHVRSIDPRVIQNLGGKLP